MRPVRALLALVKVLARERGNTATQTRRVTAPTFALGKLCHRLRLNITYAIRRFLEASMQCGKTSKVCGERESNQLYPVVGKHANEQIRCRLAACWCKHVNDSGGEMRRLRMYERNLHDGGWIGMYIRAPLAV